MFIFLVLVYYHLFVIYLLFVYYLDLLFICIIITRIIPQLSLFMYSLIIITNIITTIASAIAFCFLYFICVKPPRRSYALRLQASAPSN